MTDDPSSILYKLAAPAPSRKASRDRVVRVSSEELAQMEDRSDWLRADALTDEEIDRAIAGDPDAARVLDESFWRNAEILDPRHAKSTITMRVDERCD